MNRNIVAIDTMNETMDSMVKGLYSIYDIAVWALDAKSVQKIEKSSPAAAKRKSVCIL